MNQLALGFVVGAASSVLPGPCALAVMNAPSRRRALETAVGAGLGDGICAAAGILGLAPLLAEHPAVPRFLHALGGVALILYGLVHLHGRPAPPPGAPARSGILVGLATLALANPGAVVAWVTIVGATLGGGGLAAAAGIGLGSASWYAGVACLSHHRAWRDGMRRLAFAVACMLVVTGCAALLLSCRS